MRFGNRLVPLLAVGALLAAMVVVSSCREEEQGRILRYEKGTYLGKPDPQLTEAQVEELRARARKQAF